MILTIDNLDGQGPIDYSACVDRSQMLAVTRVLNAPSTCKGMLCLAASTLAIPVRRGRVVLTSDTGTLLFTGYLTTEPVAVYAGVASAGPVYRLALSAVSDEWLLDKQSGAITGAVFGAYAGLVLTGLSSRLAPALLNTSAVPLTGPRVGVFEPAFAAPWSAHAGALAATTGAAYRVLGGAVAMSNAGSVVHTLQDGDASLVVSAVRTGSVRELANDVTVSGAAEPTVYWTEIFLGDGTTTTFALAGQPDAPSAGHAVLLEDAFSTSAFDLNRWTLNDPGSHLAPGVGGLVMSGGNGQDGQTTLLANDAVELGGTLVLELRDVTLNAGSAGVLGGLYAGDPVEANLVAGFNIRQSGGATLCTPMVNGTETGASLTVLSGHEYTLRLHLHCAELLRTKQAFYAMTEADGALAPQLFGGGLVDAPLALVFEARDQGVASNTPVTVLYDGALTSSPASAQLAAVNSWQLFGYVGSVELSRTGTAWVRTTDPTSGVVTTRLAGSAADGVDCKVSSSATGSLTFFTGRVPVAGETIQIGYRGSSRAVARVADAASLAAEAAGGGVGTARWLGHVVNPPARSSEDCENAADAVLSFAADRTAAVAGSAVLLNPAADVWPGDVLAFTNNGEGVNAIVRKVEVEEQGASPETLTYRIAFANDWAEGLGIKLSEAIAKDALLPESAITLEPGQTPANPARLLANLQQMTVTAFTGTGSSDAITVDAGLNPPGGGGFEVRRRDGAFGAGASGDLVLRSPVRGFSIPRGAFEESFYVRMYDGSSPPLYSRWSATICTHVPLA